MYCRPVQGMFAQVFQTQRQQLQELRRHEDSEDIVTCRVHGKMVKVIPMHVSGRSTIYTRRF